jgi:hypothetical protein
MSLYAIKPLSGFPTMHNTYPLETHGVPQEKIKNVGGDF